MTEPIDETQPHPTVGSDAPPAAGDAAASAAAPPPASPSPPLQAAPPGPPSDWREPPWYPPRERSRDRGPSPIAIVIGLIVLGIGIYYFVDRTLGIALPPINWGSLWPLILIVIGVVIVVRAMSRRT